MTALQSPKIGVSRIKHALALGAALALSGLIRPAQAQSLTPELTSITLSGGVFTYNYKLQIASGTNIRPNDLITFYDFNGLLGGANSPTFTPIASGADFFIFVQNTGITANNVSPLTPDNPSLPNVTFLYTGSVISNPPATPSSAIALGFASLTSSVFINPLGSFTNYTSETENGQSGQRAATTSAIEGPNQQVATAVNGPEPATFALLALGTGVAIMGRGGLVARRRVKTGFDRKA